jgi:hypothetical protein
MTMSFLPKIGLFVPTKVIAIRDENAQRNEKIPMRERGIEQRCWNGQVEVPHHREKAEVRWRAWMTNILRGSFN